MKHFYFTVVFFALLLAAGAQVPTIQNGGFESWTNHSTDIPTGWYDSNQQAIQKFSQPNVTKVTGQVGSYAIKIETFINATDTAFGYFSNSNGDPTNGDGGVPYGAVATTISGYYKYNTVNNDTALLLVIFKAGGNIVSQDFFQIHGSQSTFTTFSFNLSVPTATPDTVIIASASSNAVTNLGMENGSFIVYDDLHFTGAGPMPPIPDGGFENWTADSYDDPNNWDALNFFNNGPYPASKTTDAHSGTYALKLETVVSSNNDTLSSITDGTYTNSGPPLGGMAYNRTADTIVGYYKYAPSGTDTGLVVLSFKNGAAQVDVKAIHLTAQSSYTYFEYPFSESIAHDTLQISIASSTYPPTTTGSILYLDDLNFKQPPPPPTTGIANYFDGTKVLAYPIPAKDALNLYYNASPGATILEVFDISGKEVFENSSLISVSGKNYYKLNTQHFETGIYFWKISTMNSVQSGKFSVQK